MGVGPKAAEEIRKLCRNKGKHRLPLRTQLNQMRNYRGKFNARKTVFASIGILRLLALGSAFKTSDGNPRFFPIISWNQKNGVPNGALMTRGNRRCDGALYVAHPRRDGRWIAVPPYRLDHGDGELTVHPVGYAPITVPMPDYKKMNAAVEAAMREARIPFPASFYGDGQSHRQTRD
jgi:hypothetical protein